MRHATQKEIDAKPVPPLYIFTSTSAHPLPADTQCHVERYGYRVLFYNPRTGFTGVQKQQLRDAVGSVWCVDALSDNTCP